MLLYINHSPIIIGQKIQRSILDSTFCNLCNLPAITLLLILPPLMGIKLAEIVATFVWDALTTLNERVEWKTAQNLASAWDPAPLYLAGSITHGLYMRIWRKPLSRTTMYVLPQAVALEIHVTALRVKTPYTREVHGVTLRIYFHWSCIKWYIKVVKPIRIMAGQVCWSSYQEANILHDDIYTDCSRLILIAERKTVYEKFPTPLINRLEKHFVSMSSVLKEWQKEVQDQLKSWAHLFCTDRYVRDM